MIKEGYVWMRLSYLFHNASLPFWESSVSPEFVIDVFHFYLDPTLGLLAIGGRRALLRRWRESVIDNVRTAVGAHAHPLPPVLLVTHVRGTPLKTTLHISIATALHRHWGPRESGCYRGWGPAMDRIVVNFLGSFPAEERYVVSHTKTGISSPSWRGIHHSTHRSPRQIITSRRGSPLTLSRQQTGRHPEPALPLSNLTWAPREPAQR